jgi:FkbM family methyltransferase
MTLPPRPRRAWRLSRLVRARVRFTAGETLRRPGAHEYVLRDVDARVVLRHNGIDAWVLHEVFGDPFYAPPPEVAGVLGEHEHVHVLDLGGNLGFFGLLALDRFPGARVTAFEPDPDNVRLLRRCIARNSLGARWEVVEACAAPADGELRFIAGDAARSRAALPGEDVATIALPAVDVFPALAAADLLKMDIEGGEWALLGDPRFGDAAPPAILLEWHSGGCPAPNARTAVTSRLREAGFEVRHRDPPTAPDDAPMWGAGVLWAWRPDQRLRATSSRMSAQRPVHSS